MVCVKFKQFQPLIKQVSLSSASSLCLMFSLPSAVIILSILYYLIKRNLQIVVGLRQLMGPQGRSDRTHEGEFADLIITNTRERQRRFLENMTNTMTIWRDL